MHAYKSNKNCWKSCVIFIGIETEDTSEGMRKFKKQKQKKSVVLFVSIFVTSLVITPLPFDSPASLFLFQFLPCIDLDNYSALPVDEGDGDEDRQAGIDDDEEDEGSDLDLGDKPEDTGQILPRLWMQDLSSVVDWGMNSELWEEKGCFQLVLSGFFFVLEIKTYSIKD